MLNPHFNLGIPRLVKDWRGMFSRRYLYDDLLAGTIVACVAIPLSLAIALASGVEPEVGLVTAIVAGIVCALFGGVPLAVSGPAAAMAVLIAVVVEDFGTGGLLLIGFGCGILQLLTGVFGLGTLIRFVPVPVVMGFTAGIGAIILIGQIPRILGLGAPEEGHILSVVYHIFRNGAHIQPNAFLLALITIALALGLPKVWPRLPAPLFAVAIPSIAAFWMHIPVETVGTIPSSLPFPKLPAFPSDINWLDLITSTFVVYALASLETLLSAGSVDQLAKSKPHDPNQELIGQGLGNISVSLFGGIPVTAVIARSALNVHAGAKTRRAAIFHSIILLATVYLFAPVMSHIPISVLSGLLVTIALRMCHPHEFLTLWDTSRIDAIIYLITFLMIVVLGLMSGIQVGIVAALIFAAIRLSQISIKLNTSKFGPAQLALDGPLTFLSTNKLDSFQKQVKENDFPNGLILDMNRVSALDTSGASHLITLIKELQSKKIKVVLYGLDVGLMKIMTGVKRDINQLIATNETDMEKILGITDRHHELTFDRLIYGIEKFKHNLQPKHKAHFTKLAKDQQPHTLFITCSDSRIDPNLITSTQPGELFIVRNVGNIIPPFGNDQTPAEGAAIEYAVGVLNVNRIIICSHSECGAINQILMGKIFRPENHKKFPSVVKWLSPLKDFSRNMTTEQATKLNASIQLNNIRTYPLVQKKLANNTLKLQVLYYDIGRAELEVFDEVIGKYRVIGENTDPIVFGENQLRGLNLDQR